MGTNVYQLIDTKLADVEPNRAEAAREAPPAGRERRDAPAEPGAAALANPTYPTASSPDAGDAESEALFAIDESSEIGRAHV